MMSVDFDGGLGDLVDVSNTGERGALWEERWGTAEEISEIVDGRAHYSVRELNKLHSNRHRFQPCCSSHF